MAPRAPDLSIRLFGNFAMEVDGKPFVMATPRRTLPILAYLLLNRHAAVSREFLAYFMWPDDSEESARTKLRANLFDLVRVLPPAPPGHWIVADGDNVSWNPQAGLRLDIEEFETLCADPLRRVEGVALYRGELLATLYDEWVFPPRERYRNLYLTSMAELVSQARRERDFPRAIALAQELLGVDPWREDIVRRLIAIRQESGDRSGALVEYQRFAERLRAELDIDPMPETQALREAIARNEAIDPEPLPKTQSASLAAAGPSLPFVGRAAEFDMLVQAWARAARGNGGAVFVGGEAGIGKSRLALEFAHRVDELGGRVLFGSTGTPEAMPYQGLIEAVRSALPLVASLRVRSAWLAGVATLVPELREHVPSLPDLSRISADSEQPRLFEALAGTLAALAQPRPLLLIVEDVQWAGEASSAALQFLLARVAAMRVLVLVTYRDEELPRLHPLQRLRRDAALAGRARSISLRPLALADVESLVRSLPESLAGTAVGLLASSDGNPLFLTQLVEGGTTAGAGAMPDVRALLAQRLDKLSPQTRTIAEIAALAGAQFSREVVRRVSGWDGGATEDALDELIEGRIVREASGRGFFDYAFAHQLVQQAIVEASDNERAPARHRRIARALEDLYPERAAELAPQAARHYDLAGDAGAAAPRYLAAARQALAVGALDEASAHVARGLELAVEPALRIDLLLVAEALAGRSVNYGSRRSLLDDLDALTRHAGDAERRRTVVLRRAVFANERKDHVAEAAALAELRPLVEAAGDALWYGRFHGAEALHLVDSADIAAAEVSAEASLAAFLAAGAHAEEAEARRRLADILMLRGDLVRAEILFEEARAAGERAHDASLSLRALKALYQLAFYRKDSQRCFEIAREELNLGFDSGDRRAEAEGHSSMADALNRTVPGGKAPREHQRAATAIFEELGDHVGTAASLVMSAAQEMSVGDLARARADCERALHIYAAHPPPARLKIVALLTLAIATLLGGDGAGATPLALEAVDIARTKGYRLLEAAALGNLADAEAVAGDYAAAIEHVSQSVAISNELNPSEHELGAGSAQLALWSVANGDLEAARMHAAVALENESGFSKASPWPQQFYWSLAQVQRACGADDAAAGALSKAHALTSASLERVDEAERERYLALPWHRDLLAAAERGQWPDPPR